MERLLRFCWGKRRECREIETGISVTNSVKANHASFHLASHKNILGSAFHSTPPLLQNTHIDPWLRPNPSRQTTWTDQYLSGRGPLEDTTDSRARERETRDSHVVGGLIRTSRHVLQVPRPCSETSVLSPSTGFQLCIFLGIRQKFHCCLLLRQSDQRS